MNSRYCIISGQDNRPLTGVVFNDLTAAYELTLPGVVVREQTWTDCMKILNRDAEASQLADRMGRFEKNLTVRLQKYGLKPRSGRALFSALLPEDFYYRKGRVRIIEGILVRGQIDKSTAVY